MIELNIPRRDSLRLHHLVTDVSGVCLQPRRGDAESSRAGYLYNVAGERSDRNAFIR